MNAFNHLLSGAIDYAGVFPPASLDVETSLGNYADYSVSDDSWALGRIILPVSALHHGVASLSTSRMSVLLGPDYEKDLEVAARFGGFEVFECKVNDISDIEKVAQIAPTGARIFFEGASGTITPDWATTIRQTGNAAKIRTGGVTSSAIPPSTEIACFLARCVAQQLPFKATAGLHHPIRSSHALTYEANSPIAIMHGFVNVMIATALLLDGETVETAREVIEETNPASFAWRVDGLSWRDCDVSIDQIDSMRRSMLSFGSCSFSEPIADSRTLRWLQ